MLCHRSACYRQLGIVFILLLQVFFIPRAVAWQLPDTTDQLTFSLVTGSPGSDLYAVFGHSAIRLRNHDTGQDILYNYGTFDFNTPHFYWKFLRGKLLYMLSIDRTEELSLYYRYENRALTEQIMNLNPTQKAALAAYLEWNYQPEHRYYLYDFFYDNCATVIRDVLEKQFNLQYVNDSTRNITFRQLLDEYLTNMPWSDFGIDLVLGLPADKRADFRNHMFLPDYLAAHLAQATLDDGRPLLQPAQILQPRTLSDTSHHLFTPMLLFVIVALLAIAITLSKNKTLKNIFDWFVLFSCGLGGLLLAFMWFGTDHIATKWNWNILWLNPLCIMLLWGMWREASWLRIAFATYAAILWLLLLTWGWFPQQFNMAVIPIWIALIARSMDREGVVFGLLLEKFNPQKN